MYLDRRSHAFLDFYESIQNDIFKFCQAMRFTPTAQQVPILEAVQRGETHVGCKSGQGPGKTTLSVIIGLWRAFRRFGALTVVTAPTMRQAKEVWLAEARARISKADPEIQRFFEVRATEIEIMGIEDWGVKLASASKPENMQGWHNDFLTFIVDEASGVARTIIETILGTLTNRDKLMMQIGNPNTRDSSFFDCFHRDRKKWWVYTMNAEESPLVDKANIRRMEELYGRNSDVFRVRVLGEFPLQDPMCVMNSDDLEACSANRMVDCSILGFHDILKDDPTKTYHLYPNLMKQISSDFARFGDDMSVTFRRSGMAIVEQKYYAKVDPSIVVGDSFVMQDRSAWRNSDCLYVVDAGGMGQGLMHHYYNQKKRVVEFHSEGVPANPEIFHDAITEAMFNLGELVKSRRIYLPDDPELVAQLSTRQYNMTLKSKIKLESKKEYKDRMQTGSPDKADAAAMVFYNKIAASGAVTALR